MGFLRSPTAARAGIALLAAALVVALGLAYAQYRDTRALQSDVTEQRRQLAELERKRAKEAESPLAGLLGGGGSDAPDLGGLLGGAGGSQLSCAGGDLLGGAGGGGKGPNLDKLLEGLSQPGGKGPDLDKLLEGLSQPGGKGPNLDKLLEGLSQPGGKGPNLDKLLEGLGGGSTGGSADPAQLVPRVSRQVEDVRKLRFEREVDAKLLGDRALGKRLEELVREDYPREAADREGRVLAALGAVPPETDMLALRLRALQGQVAGLYVPETGELLVRSSGSAGSLEKLILAHELEHALADQRLDLPVPEKPDPERSDADLAALAVVEGDATLTMQRYSLQGLGGSGLLGLVGEAQTLLDSQRQLSELPHYLQQELQFPYLGGLEFVCDRFQEGGWSAVNRAYDDPPAATDQVLFPDRYGEDAPEAPPQPGSLSAPWSRSLTTQLGAAQMGWLFEAPGGDTSAAIADPEGMAAAWGGGTIDLWEDGARSAVALSLREREGEDGLCDAVAEWYEAAFPDADTEDGEEDERLTSDGERQDAVVACEDDAVQVGIAPDLDGARDLLATG